ncbi:insulinase family protein [Propioniciclava sp. MC1683]|uniref:M16 family metallopeptidase n=1 Tax=Propioniciclava sp. MC1683 TaxID=2760309 RepID=UPI001600F297|nr:insulinase family protein [Propioniciclava sp. MC1683]MBB1501869.1 insulinase family protein [Propioniciclava sp. MC1683]
MTIDCLTFGDSTVIVDSLPGIASVCATVWIGRGSRDETPATLGAAHLLEHLVTAAHEDVPGGFVSMVDAVGGQYKVLTTPEFTVYGFTASADSWERPWAALTNQLTSVSFDSALFEHQRTIVLNEIADAADDQSRAAHQLAIQDLLGPHPLANPAMGTIDGIHALSPAAVRTHMKAAHRRPDVTIVLSGAVDRTVGGHLAGTLIEALPRTSIPTRRTPPVAIPGRTVRQRQQSRSQVLVSWLLPSAGSLDAATLGVLNRVMGAGAHGRLRDRFAASDSSYSLYSYRSTFSDCAIWTVYTMCDPRDQDRVTGSIIEAHYELSGSRPPANDEVHRAGAALAGSLALGLESTHMRANWLGRSFLTHPEVPSYEGSKSRLAQVGADHLVEMVERMGEPSVTILEGRTGHE